MTSYFVTYQIPFFVLQNIMQLSMSSVDEKCKTHLHLKKITNPKKICTKQINKLKNKIT